MAAIAAPASIAKVTVKYVFITLLLLKHARLRERADRGGGRPFERSAAILECLARRRQDKVKPLNCVWESGQGQACRYGALIRRSHYECAATRKKYCGDEILFDAFAFETLDKRNYLSLFRIGYFELCQRRGSVFEEHVPVALAYAHASMREGHVPATIVSGPACARTEKVDEELLFTHDPILSAMRPEATELRIAPQPWQQIVHYRRDCGMPAKALVQGLCIVTHRFILRCLEVPAGSSGTTSVFVGAEYKTGRVVERVTLAAVGSS
jgi:hypothetical protein